ncbi:MAG: hypothetical protein NUV69_01165 [Candidatus Curtissbacteria bacterium]|nr:hypothetical protein [Candidatus Curtissbacteria bacterium]
MVEAVVSAIKTPFDILSGPIPDEVYSDSDGNFSLKGFEDSLRLRREVIKAQLDDVRTLSPGLYWDASDFVGLIIDIDRYEGYLNGQNHVGAQTALDVCRAGANTIQENYSKDGKFSESEGAFRIMIARFGELREISIA